MRYIEVPVITFTDINGNQFPVHEIREFPTYQTAVIFDLKKGMMLDEIISRENLYGDGSEDFTYVLFDHNKEKLTENNFVLSKLKKLNIPTIENTI